MPTRRLTLTDQTKQYVSELKLHESDQINFFGQMDISVFEYICLQLGDPLAVGARVLFPVLLDRARSLPRSFICVVFLVAGLGERFALQRASGLAAPYPRPPSGTCRVHWV